MWMAKRESRGLGNADVGLVVVFDWDNVCHERLISLSTLQQVREDDCSLVSLAHSLLWILVLLVLFSSNVESDIVTPRTPLLPIECVLVYYNVAAASIAPAALKAVLFVITTSTGYFHSINFAQPSNS